MKIVMIGQKGLPSRLGGIEVHVEELAKRLVEDNNQVLAYVREDYCSEKHKEYQGIEIVTIKHIQSKYFDTLTYSFLATIKAIKTKADIIHFHALGPSIFAFIPRIFGIKVVSTVHGLDWKREKWGKAAKQALKIGEWVGIHFANKTIVVGQHLIPYYLQKHNKEVVFIPNGVNLYSPLQDEEIFEKFGIVKDGYILFLSRIVPEKGLHFLIKAYNQLKLSKKLVIAGTKSHSDEYYDEIMDLAKDNPNIIFTGFVDGEILKALFSNAFLYVLPSTIEGLPISLLEAMSYGLNCLTSDIDENTNVIKQYGSSFKCGDINDLKEHLVRLVNSKKEVNKQEIIEYIKANYSWKTVTEQVEKVYHEVLDGNK